MALNSTEARSINVMLRYFVQGRREPDDTVLEAAAFLADRAQQKTPTGLDSADVHKKWAAVAAKVSPEPNREDPENCDACAAVGDAGDCLFHEGQALGEQILDAARATAVPAVEFTVGEPVVGTWSGQDGPREVTGPYGGRNTRASRDAAHLLGYPIIGHFICEPGSIRRAEGGA